jgi:ferric-dicitrate binding protein FerR (iron transport regulator)
MAHMERKKITVHRKSDLLEEIGWMDGVFRFKNAPLSDVIASIQRQFDVKIRLGKQFAKERFTGGYNNEDLEKALKVINTVLGSEYRFLDERTIEIY